MILHIVSLTEHADFQRKILEEKQRQKRLLTGGIRLNDPPKENLNSRSIISRSGGSNRELYAYDGPLSFAPEDPDRISPSIAGPTIITVRGVTPPPVQSSSDEDESLLSKKLLDDAEKSDPVATSIPEAEEDLAVEPWRDEIEENILAGTEYPDINEIITNLEQFVMAPAKRNVTYKCRITRDKKGVDRGISNALGTQFTLYDNGENPKKAAVIGDGVRQELAAVIYETNVLGFKGPRKMTVLIPGIYDTENYRRKQIRPVSEKDAILERWKSHRTDELIAMHNKNPVWNEG
ncbi:unnamed protein product [Toxocara canis]|uniref:Tub domain-containing protein n=1 Tax=Toxocara canis TaxID=6265 RepID=A0A183UWC8_TOXCA|nr:unnamed protein product [Toxocara canis]